MAYKDKEKQKAFQRVWQRKLYYARKQRAIKILGGKCVECGTDDFRVLEFDHIEPVLRPSQSNSGVKNAADVVSGKLTKDDIQLLCANCHAIKTYEIDRHKFRK